MKIQLGRCGLSFLLAVTSCAAGKSPATQRVASNSPTTQPVANSQMASLGAPVLPASGNLSAPVFNLEVKAFDAAREGHFDQTDHLLAQAVSLSSDAQVRQMAAWAGTFETQLDKFANSRRGEFKLAVANTHLLLDHKLDDYAIDEASQAYLLADDREAFRREPWVDALVKHASDSADRYESHGQWLKALRVYADLGTLEPYNSIWKDKLKLATRRVRLLMVYAPDKLKKIQASEAKDRDAAEALLHPATRPTTRPLLAAAGLPAVNPLHTATRPDEVPPAPGATTQPELDLGTSYGTDWREVTKGIRYDMLWDAMVITQQQYYRDVSFQTLLIGGLKGLRAVATTPGLEETFAGLGDTAKRDKFIATIDACMKNAQAATPDNSEEVLSDCLDRLRSANRDTVALPEEVMVSEFADGAYSELDPFSTIIWPYDVEEFQKKTQGEFGGVGLQIENDDAGYLKVVSPLEDSPGYRLGIRAGDLITKINGRSCKGVVVDQAVNWITGTPGTIVTLTIKSPDGTEKDYPIRRELIKVASIKGYLHKPGGGWEYFIDPREKIADVRLTEFTKTTSEDLDKALDEIKADGCRGIILDLRDDPGGLLEAAIEVVNKFVGHGVIVSTRPNRVTENPPTVAEAKPDEVETDLPMIVLVNQYSASASEIVSGALKDHHRALVVGERTFGKGSVQMLFPLNDRQAYLKLTTSRYYLPSGRSIHREDNSTKWGVDPDAVVDMTPDQMRAAINARQDLDVLRDRAEAAKVKPSTQPAVQELLSTDPQLSAALLIMRMELSL